MCQKMTIFYSMYIIITTKSRSYIYLQLNLFDGRYIFSEVHVSNKLRKTPIYLETPSVLLLGIFRISVETFPILA